MPRKLTDEQINAILKGISQGKSVVVIADEVGVCPATVIRIKQRHHIPEKANLGCKEREAIAEADAAEEEETAVPFEESTEPDEEAVPEAEPIPAAVNELMAKRLDDAEAQIKELEKYKVKVKAAIGVAVENALANHMSQLRNALCGSDATIRMGELNVLLSLARTAEAMPATMSEVVAMMEDAMP